MTHYYLIDQHLHFIKANKAGFMKLFPDRTHQIKYYVKEHNIRFHKDEDVKKLFRLCLATS
jgi:hypothetical protein